MFVRAEKDNHSVAMLCRVLKVSRSGYYAWCARKPSARAIQDERLRARLRVLHRESGGTYGAPRLHQDLVEEGERLGRKRVARLMAQDGIQGLCAPPRVVTTWPSSEGSADDLVRRDFTAEAPNHIWTADTTYVRCGSRFLFLVAIIDLFSRRVVGWSLGRRLDARLACQALSSALVLRRPSAGLIVHSDRGSEFVNKSFGDLLESRGARRSLGRVGDCYDNAVSESFFGTMKLELGLLRGRGFEDDDQAEEVLNEYINHFYNRRRRHSTIGYASPVDYELAMRGERVAA